MEKSLPGTLVLATGNAGKLREFRALLADLAIEVVPQSEFDVPTVPETGLTFIENALIKARNAARHTGLPALADDSGLAVDALHGRPGIYSARYSGPDADDLANNRKLLEELAGVPEQDRGARYHCILVFLRDAEDPVPLVCEAAWEGRIAPAPRGEGGFGYDPLFLPADGEGSAAELDPAIKNRRSHRGRAMALLRERLASLGS